MNCKITLYDNKIATCILCSNCRKGIIVFIFQFEPLLWMVLLQTELDKYTTHYYSSLWSNFITKKEKRRKKVEGVKKSFSFCPSTHYSINFLSRLLLAASTFTFFCNIWKNNKNILLKPLFILNCIHVMLKTKIVFVKIVNEKKIKLCLYKRWDQGLAQAQAQQWLQGSDITEAWQINLSPISGSGGQSAGWKTSLNFAWC